MNINQEKVSTVLKQYINHKQHCVHKTAILLAQTTTVPITNNFYLIIMIINQGKKEQR